MNTTTRPRRRRPLTERSRGGPFCSFCGEEVRWIKLDSGAWIAAEKKPTLYLPDAGREWIIEGKRYDARIIKNARIWRKGDPIAGVKRGYKIHAFDCFANR